MERSAPTPPVERTANTPPEDRGLRREAIGLREVFFQSVTHMAPAAAVAFSIIVGANFASGALPLSVLFALVGCLLVAISIGQLAKHLPSAGGFYTYTARGIHPSIGFLVAWGYAFVEPLVAPALFLIFGQVVAGMLQTEFGWSFSTWWWRCPASPPWGSWRCADARSRARWWSSSWSRSSPCSRHCGPVCWLVWRWAPRSIWRPTRGRAW